MKRNEQKLETRERILEAAFSRFVENGIQGTKTADIAHAANLSHGAIFVHFKTRQAIVLGVVERFGATFGARMRELDREGQSVRSVLEGFVRALEDYEAFYGELVLILGKMPDTVQGCVLGVQNGLAEYLLPAIRAELSPVRFAELGEDGVLNSWFALLHYFLSTRHWYGLEAGFLEQRGAELIDDYCKLLGLP